MVLFVEKACGSYLYPCLSPSHTVTTSLSLSHTNTHIHAQPSRTTISVQVAAHFPQEAKPIIQSTTVYKLPSQEGRTHQLSHWVRY